MWRHTLDEYAGTEAHSHEYDGTLEHLHTSVEAQLGQVVRKPHSQERRFSRDRSRVPRQGQGAR